MKGKYYKQLAHPRWKAKVAFILKRDGYKCTACGKRQNLRVHHSFYYKTYVNIWDYPDDSLITVCEDCHYDYHCHHETPIVIAVPKRIRDKQNKPKQPAKRKRLKFKDEVAEEKKRRRRIMMTGY